MQVKPWILKRPKKALLELEKDLIEDTDDYLSCLRMDKKTFEQLLRDVAPLIRKKDTLMRQSISPRERLIVTLRYLATGEYRRPIFYPRCNFFGDKLNK